MPIYTSDTVEVTPLPDFSPIAETISICICKHLVPDEINQTISDYIEVSA